MAVIAWEYTLCPNCGKDHGWLHPVTGWCTLCTSKTKTSSVDCIVCGSPIYAVRKDAKFCSGCKNYKTYYHWLTGKQGMDPAEALTTTRERYREELFE